jgi:3-oxoacyl-[acyl-carrier-protein] synthase-3
MAERVPSREALPRPAGVRISGTGIALPQRVVGNAALEAQLGLTAGWIEERTGVRERRVATEERPIDLGFTAGAAALADAGIAPDEIDLLLFATLTPEMPTPASACRVAERLGAVPCGALDLSVACTGFVAGLGFAADAIALGRCRHVLVIGAEVISRVVDWTDARTAPLFGDAAAAAVVSPSDDPRQGCLFQHLGADARDWHDLFVPREAADLPPGREPPPCYNTIQMTGRPVFRFAVSTLDRILPEAAAACGLGLRDLRRILLHQSNARIIDKVRADLGLPPEQVPVNIDRYGNTSAASVGLVLHEARQRGDLRPGDLVLFGAVGGGMTWGTSLWRF